MGKVRIEFEDKGGNVSVTVQPSVEMLFQKVQSGHEITAAEAYALRALRSVREDAKVERNKSSILAVDVPRVGR